MVFSRRAVFFFVVLLAPACSLGLVGDRGPEGPRGPQGARGEPGTSAVVTVAPGGQINMVNGVIEVQAPPPARRDLVLLQADGGFVGRVVDLTPDLTVWLEEQQCVATLTMTDVHPGWPTLQANESPGLATGSDTCGFGTPMLQTRQADFACQRDLRGAWFRAVQPMQLRVFRNLSQPLEDGGCLALSPNSRGLVLEQVRAPQFEGPFMVVSE